MRHIQGSSVVKAGRNRRNRVRIGDPSCNVMNGNKDAGVARVVP